MRYAVFSDVHANLEAFESILEVFKESHIEKYIFVGDIVGYGADPQPCIQKLRALEALCVAGNHDWGSVGLTDIEYFNQAARSALQWTMGQLSDSDKDFLSGLQLVQEGKLFSVVHGSLHHPDEFPYINNNYEAYKAFGVLKKHICLVAHSHKPGVFVEGQNGITFEHTFFMKFSSDKRYIVNVGSVGQPRDGDPRSCFCIYDDQAQELEFKRVVYDVASAQKKIKEAGLPRFLADRLSEGR